MLLGIGLALQVDTDGSIYAEVKSWKAFSDAFLALNLKNAKSNRNARYKMLRTFFVGLPHTKSDAKQDSLMPKSLKFNQNKASQTKLQGAQTKVQLKLDIVENKTAKNQVGTSETLQVNTKQPASNPAVPPRLERTSRTDPQKSSAAFRRLHGRPGSFRVPVISVHEQLSSTPKEPPVFPTFPRPSAELDQITPVKSKEQQIRGTG